MLFLVHGGFTTWTVWGPCSQTCGEGTQRRSRQCTNPAPRHGGNDCTGSYEEFQTCEIVPCPSKILFINRYILIYFLFLMLFIVVT